MEKVDFGGLIKRPILNINTLICCQCNFSPLNPASPLLELSIPYRQEKVMKIDKIAQSYKISISPPRVQICTEVMGILRNHINIFLGAPSLFPGPFFYFLLPDWCCCLHITHLNLYFLLFLINNMSPPNKDIQTVLDYATNEYIHWLVSSCCFSYGYLFNPLIQTLILRILFQIPSYITILVGNSTVSAPNSHQL